MSSLSIFAGAALAADGASVAGGVQVEAPRLEAPDAMRSQTSGSTEPPSGGVAPDEPTQPPEKAFFGGEPKPRVQYTLAGEGESDVRIDVIRREPRGVMRSWTERAQPAGEAHEAIWNGRKDGGKVAPNANYKFRVTPVSEAEAQPSGGEKFEYYRYKFPVRGAHTYGDGVGAGRGHRGQDVFADCGTKLVAARGGKVQWKAYQADGAGYYVVIDGKATERDYVYMHLKDRAIVREGERVRTGQEIGRVGSTGNSSGCHLHFEVWSPPGWFEGGSYMNSVTRQLKLWDSWS